MTRILWDSNATATSTGSSTLKAKAVEYVVNNETLVVNVTREVVVSAGTIGSPKVLELSGVGNTTYVDL